MNRVNLWFAVVALVVGHLVFDFFMPGLVFGSRGVEGEVVAFALLGVCFGQVNLIASWATLAPGPIIVRMPWAAFLATLMWYAFLLGNNAFHRPLSREEAVLLGWVLLGGVLLAQFPLWISSRFFRWRLVPPARADQRSTWEQKQFHIQHLFVGMFFVSLALALCRVLLPEGDIWIPTSIDDELKVLLPVTAIWNVLTTVPCFWAAFAKREGMVGLFFCWFVYCAVLTTVEIVVLIMALGGPPPSEAFMMIYVFNLMQGWCVVGSLLIIRSVGFQFRRINSDYSAA
jgi:hypothetical protein